MKLIYDGSFECFLSLVHDVYYKKIRPFSISSQMPQTLLQDEIYVCEYEEKKSLKVLDALREKFTKENLTTILNTFMCEGSGFEMALLEYIVLGFKAQSNLQNINEPCVFKIQNLQKELFRNVHKMSGFLRFEELEDGTLYAKLESKYNLLYFLGKHFAKRLHRQNFIIHDIKRSLAYVHAEGFSGVREVAEFDMPSLSKNEQKFKDLWQTFFDTVAIESRKNEKLQQQLVPLIYRVYMSEFIN